ncbi:MAG: hypothetical protein JWM96_808 [Alphaproteobacteria bacterium]|nr:hypothetical protein [Alphaproteobacteria bacterium]
MRKIILLPVLALFLSAALLTSRPARAVQGAMMTGRNLALLCSNTEKADNQFACQSYIAGIIDYHNLIRSLRAAPSVDFCLPRELTMGQIRLIVYNYILRHSEHQDFIAAPGVAMALYSAYPCKKAKR